MANYHTTAAGQIPFTADEEAEYAAQVAAYPALAKANKIKEQIADLESQTQSARTVREHILGIDTTRLPALQQQITELKAKLKV